MAEVAGTREGRQGSGGGGGEGGWGVGLEGG